MLSIPVGATVTRVYFTLPNHIGHTGPEFNTQYEANTEALRRWGANQSNLPIPAPTVKQRMVFTVPDGGGALDTVVDTEVVFPNLTTPAPSSAQQRAALAEAAIRQLMKFHALAEEIGIAKEFLATTETSTN